MIVTTKIASEVKTSPRVVMYSLGVFCKGIGKVFLFFPSSSNSFVLSTYSSLHSILVAKAAPAMASLALDGRLQSFPPGSTIYRRLGVQKVPGSRHV